MITCAEGVYFGCCMAEMGGHKAGEEPDELLRGKVGAGDEGPGVECIGRGEAAFVMSVSMSAVTLETGRDDKMDWAD